MSPQKARGPGETLSFRELEGFYVGQGRCLHFTFEDKENFVIDIFDTEAAAYDGNAGGIVGKPVLINVRSGEVTFEE